MPKRAVFLDRDNTIIAAKDPEQPDRFSLIKGAASALASLQGLDFRLVIVTNEPAVADGRRTEAEVDQLNDQLAAAVDKTTGAQIDRFYYCPFEPNARVVQFAKDHPWRMPRPGMWEQAAKDLGLDLKLCWTVGRSPEDIAAGKAAGTRTILLDPAGRESEAALAAEPHFVVGSLIEAARTIAQQRPVPLEHTAEHAGSIEKPTSTQRPGKLYPANQPIADQQTSATSKPKNRPFVPWSIQPDADGDHPPMVRVGKGTQAQRHKGTKGEDKEARGHGGTEGGPRQESGKSGKQEISQAESTPQAGPERRRSAGPGEPEPVAKSPTPPKPAAPPPPAPTPTTPAPSAPSEARRPSPPPSSAPSDTDLRETNALLRQVLAELKAQRVDSDDFSMDKVLAGLAQMGAIACVVIGLIVQFTMGVEGVFIQWLAGGIFLQLLVVAMLLLKLLK